MKSKTIKSHSDSNWFKGFSRYMLMTLIVDSNSWSDMEAELKKRYDDDCKKKTSQLFNEFKLHNVILGVEYHITDLLNNFLAKENKIKNWDKLKNRFVEKIERNKNKTKNEAKEILRNETGGKRERMLTPALMFDSARFGLGELIGYINEFTSSFPEKKKLVNKLTEFNRIRNIVIHRLITSRENVEEEIEKGILKGKESIDLINEIIDYDPFTKTDL